MKNSSNKKYCVYKITNLIDDKIYIGKTTADPSKRWKKHIDIATNDKYKKDRRFIHHAINKYGIDFFKFEIIEYFDNEDSAYKAEKEYIKKLKVIDIKYGYNLDIGKSCANEIDSLNEEQIKLLFNDYAIVNLSIAEISKKYKMAQYNILSIIERNKYQNINICDDVLYQLWLKLNCNNLQIIQSKKLVYPINKLCFIDRILLDFILYENSLQLFLEENNISEYNWEKILIIAKKDEKYRKILQTVKYKINNNYYEQKISNEDVIFIFEKFADNSFSIRDLAKKFGLTTMYIRSILIRKRKSYVIINSNILDIVNRKVAITSKKTRKEIEEIKLLLIEDFKFGVSAKDLSKKYNLSYSFIRGILNGKGWTSTKTETFKDRNIISEETAQNIFDDFCKNGLSKKDIETKYNYCIDSINSILHGDIFPNLNRSKEDLEFIKNNKKCKRLIPEDIKEIFRLHVIEDYSRQDLMKKFNINDSTLSSILTRKIHSKIEIDQSLIDAVSSKNRRNMTKEQKLLNKNKLSI